MSLGGNSRLNEIKNDESKLAETRNGRNGQKLVDSHLNYDSSTPIHQHDQFSSFYSSGSKQMNLSPPRGGEKGSETSQRRRPSLNTFESFSSSVLLLPTIITAKDFESYTNNYKNLIEKSQNYRQKLIELAAVTNEFGDALDDCINKCPKVNNTKIVNDGLINSSGLQYMLSSNNQILCKLIDDNFEKPLKQELAKLELNYQNNYNYYQQEIKTKTKNLRLKELENIKLTNQKTKNLHLYKSNLVNLTNQLNEIDRLKYDYYNEINSMIESFNQRHLLIRTGSLVKAQLELIENIARKGWSGGGLDDLLAISPDLFDSNDEVETPTINSTINASKNSNILTTINDTFDMISNEADHTLETIKINHDSNPLIMKNPRSLTPEINADNIEANISMQPHTIEDNLYLPTINNSNSLHPRGELFDDQE